MDFEREYHEKSGRRVRSDKFRYRQGQEGAGEGQRCRMAPEEPEANASSALPPTLEQCLRVQEAANGGTVALLPPPKLECCRVSVCRKCHQPQMVATKPALSPQKIAAKIAKKVRVAEEACRAQESIVADTAFMHRHSAGDQVARRAHYRPTRADWFIHLGCGVL